jgi:V-type H+-transporting ATPase proteolipid subunit
MSQGFEDCPSWTPVLGFTSAAICIVLSNWGAAWGTWKSGIGLCKMGVNHPGGIIKNLVAIIMAGVLGIYGLIVAIIIAGGVSSPMNNGNTYSQFTGWAHMAAGLCCGFSCLAAGFATGVAGEVGIVATGLRAELNHAKNMRSMMGMGGAASAAEVVDEGDAGKLYIGSVTILSFSGAIGLYGFIVALIITSSDYYPCDYA